MKKKIILTILLILLIITIGLGSTYAYWQKTSITTNNIIKSDCLDVEFEENIDNSNITLTSAYPMSDEEGIEGKYYSFTLRNKCNNKVKVNINIDTLKDSTLDEKYIKYNLERNVTEISDYGGYYEDGFGRTNYSSGYTLTTYDGGNKTSIIGNELKNISSNDNIKTSHLIHEDILEKDYSKTYYLRLWLDNDSPIEETINKTWTSKISINETITNNNSYTTLITGNEFQELLESNNIDKTLITNITTTTTKPDETINKYKVSSDDSLYEVYAYLDNTNLVLYSEDGRIYLNKDSENIFNGFSSITKFNANILDFYLVSNLVNGFSNMTSLEEIDVTRTNLVNVYQLDNLFDNSINLKTIKGMDDIELDNVKTLNNAFRNTSIEYLNLSSIRTSWMYQNVTLVGDGSTKIKTINLSNWDFTRIRINDLQTILNKSITSITLRNTTLGTYLGEYDTFYYSESYPKGQAFGVNKVYDKFDITNAKFVGNMEGVLQALRNTKITGLSTVDTSRAGSFKSLFGGTNIYNNISEISYWNVSNVKNFDNFFGVDNSVPYNLAPLNRWFINSEATFNNFLQLRAAPSSYTMPSWSGGTWQETSGYLSFIRN